MTEERVSVSTIKPGMKIQGTYLVAEKNLAYSQKGNPYLNLRLRDKTGDIEARVWDNAIAIGDRFEKGDVINVTARVVLFREMTQLSIMDVTPVEESSIDPADYSPTTRHDIDDMFTRLTGYIEGMTDVSLKQLLTLIFTDEKIRDDFKKAPAAKGFHHSYIGGLLEHTLSVVTLLDAITAHYPEVNRDLVIAGGILHDIGKIEELSFRKMIDYTDEGRLIGHIVLGLELLDRHLAKIDDFPEKTAMELRHILLSHHGILEYGSPKRPKSREALIVNYVDDLDAKVNAFQGFMESADDDATWTPFHRLLERFIYKG